jgi:hypothetical protein
MTLDDRRLTEAVRFSVSLFLEFPGPIHLALVPSVDRGFVLGWRAASPTEARGERAGTWTPSACGVWAIASGKLCGGRTFDAFFAACRRFTVTVGEIGRDYFSVPFFPPSMTWSFVAGFASILRNACFRSSSFPTNGGRPG